MADNKVALIPKLKISDFLYFHKMKIPKTRKTMLKKLAVILMALSCIAMAENEGPHSLVIDKSAEGYFEFEGTYISENDSLKQYAGKSVYLSIKAGYTVISASATYGKGQSVKITPMADNENLYTFAMPDADVVIKGTFEKKKYAVSVEGCDGSKLICVNAPDSALFEDRVTVIVRETVTDTLKISLNGGSDVAIVNEGENTKITFVMSFSDAKITLSLIPTKEEPKPTRFKLSASCSSAKNCMFKDAKNNVVDSANVKDEVHLFMELPSEAGNFEINGKGINLDDLQEIEEAKHYKFIMPDNDVSISINLVSSKPSDEEDDPPSSSSSSSESEGKTDTLYVVDSVPYYTVNIDACENGEIIRTGAFVKGTENAAYEDYDITLYAYPKEGYALDTIFVETTDGDAVKLQKKGDAYTFKMPAHDVKVSAKYKVAEYNITIKGCEKLKCEAPAKAKMGDEISVRILLKEGVTGFKMSAAGIGKMNQEQKDDEILISFKMPANDVTLTLDVSVDDENIESSDSKDDSSSSSSDSKNSDKDEKKSDDGKKKSDKDKDAVANVVKVPQFSVVVNGRLIQVAHASIGRAYAVFDMNGHVLKAGRVESENFNVEVNRAGNFVLRIGEQVRALNVK